MASLSSNRHSSITLLSQMRRLAAFVVLVHCFCDFIVQYSAAGNLVEVKHMTTAEMEDISAPEFPASASFKCQSGRVCGLHIVSDDHGSKSYIDVDAREGITLPAGTTLAGHRQFEHPVYFDTENPVTSRQRHVSFSYNDGFTIRPRRLECFMITQTMPGNFNIGTDYVCPFPRRFGGTHSYSGRDGVIAAGHNVAIYRELNSAEQLLDGTIIYNVGSGDDRITKAVISRDVFWSIQALHAWVDRTFPILLSIWTVTGVLSAYINGSNLVFFVFLWSVGVYLCFGAHYLALYIQESRHHGTTISVQPSLFQQDFSSSAYESKTALFLTIGLSIGGILVLVAIIAFFVQRKKSSNRFNTF